MSLQIKQFRYSHDNFSYLLFDQQDALAVDGGAVDDILHFVAAHDLTLKCVTNTHLHYDHTSGNRSLVDMTRAEFVDCRILAEQREVRLGNESIKVLPTPGHSNESICLYTGHYLISGDTLFNGTVGNCFSGDLQGFYDSIKTLMALPDETVVYAGHDYVRESMAFARMLEPENPTIDVYLEKYTTDHVCSIIGMEKMMNPFVRFDEPDIVAMLRHRKLPCLTSYERWCSLMSIEE